MDVRELYQELILDHGKHPRNAHFPPTSNHGAEGKNPLCGDRLVVRVLTRDGIIEDIGFEGEGCAISTAAASVMTEAVKGRTVEEAETLFAKFRDLVTGRGDADPEALGKLTAFGGLSDYPMRVKCGTLAWHTLHAALEGQEEVVTTE